MRQVKLSNENYFRWLFDLVCRNRYSDRISYERLLRYLHDTEFIYVIDRDGSRAEDGVYLRYRFEDEVGDIVESDSPCTVLEMMVALALRCEETIMDDAELGSRMGQWFWDMIVNLGLGSMTDDRFDEGYVESVIDIFLYREYEPNGKGGLFTVNGSHDLRHVEIWFQLLWYLDYLNGEDMSR